LEKGCYRSGEPLRHPKQRRVLSFARLAGAGTPVAPPAKTEAASLAGGFKAFAELCSGSGRGCPLYTDET